VPLTRFNILTQRERGILFWILQITGWLASFFVVLIAAKITDTTIGWLVIFRTVFGFLVTSILLRPLLRYCRSKFATSFVKLAVVGVLLAIVFGALDSYLTERFGILIGLDMQATGVVLYIKASYVLRSAIFGFWILLYIVVNYWLDSRAALLRAARLEMDRQASDLKLLRAQVNPHFLFNALNSILAVCDEPQKVVAITQALADYLRFSLRGGDARQPLGEELDALENYLRVEKIRFTDKLEYTIQGDAAARRKLVPGALVQPLVENAIKFGQRTSPRPLRIAVQARLRGGDLEVLVENSGHWVTENDAASTGIGLSNLRQRLQLICGPLATVTTAKAPPDRVILQVILPEEYLLSSKL